MPVRHHPRTAGRTKYGVWNRLGRGIYDLAMVRWYLKRQIKTLIPAVDAAADKPGARETCDVKP